MVIIIYGTTRCKNIERRVCPQTQLHNYTTTNNRRTNMKVIISLLNYICTIYTTLKLNRHEQRTRSCTRQMNRLPVTFNHVISHFKQLLLKG